MREPYHNIDIFYFEFIGVWQLLTQGLKNGNKSAILSVACGILFSIFISMQFLNMLFGGYDFSTFCEKLSVNLTCLESVIKMSFYYFKREQLLDIFELFRMDLLYSAEHNTEIAVKILSSNAKTVNKTTKGFVYMIFTTVGIWNCLPLLRCVSAVGCTSIQIMPTWYPIDLSHFPISSIIYLLEFFIMIYCATLLYNVNCIFSALALTVSSQFKLLSTNIRNIQSNTAMKMHHNGKGNLNYVNKEDVMYALLRDCLIDHQTLLRLTKEMEDIFNPIFLFQMLTSTFTICLVLVQLNHHASSSAELSIAMGCKFMMYLVFGSVELFVYSWCGQIIHDESEDVYWSLQRCGWEEASHKFKTNIEIALIRSQFPVSLTAGKFYSVDLASFAQVIKASYSYFTFLHGSDIKK